MDTYRIDKKVVGVFVRFSCRFKRVVDQTFGKWVIVKIIAVYIDPSAKNIIPTFVGTCLIETK
jgi:hypothetical protein